MSATTLELLAKRRSVPPALLIAPGPTPAEIEQLLTIGARVADHKKLAPWRFMLFEGEARAKAGAIFAEAALAEELQTPSEDRLKVERERFLRAPLVIGVVSVYKPHPAAPEWEQILSAGACCQNIVVAANALGYGTSWITEWVSYSPTVRRSLGLTANERIAGFVYIGTPKERPPERERPNLADITSRWS